MKFSYEVVSVDTTNKVMDVRFSAENEESVLMAMPMPKVGEDIRELMAGYAPVVHWEQQKAEVQSVSVGATGEVWSEHPTQTAEQYAAQQAADEALLAEDPAE